MPAWLPGAFAAPMLAVAAVSAARLVAARPWRRGAVVTGTDVAHLLMATAMAGMLTPRLHTLPGTGWGVIFGLLAAWFAVRVALDARANGVRALARGHCAPHLVHSGAMLYMFLAVAAPAAGMTEGGPGGMSGLPGMMMTTLRYPVLAIAFALFLAGYSVWDLDQLSGRRHTPGAARVPLAGAAAARVPVMTAAELGPARPGPLPPAGTPDVAGQPGAAEGQPATGRGGAGGRAPAGVGGLLLSPAVTVGGRVVMGVVMAFMLVIAA